MASKPPTIALMGLDAGRCVFMLFFLELSHEEFQMKRIAAPMVDGGGSTMTTRRLTKFLALVGGVALVGVLVLGILLALSIRHGLGAHDEPSSAEAKLARSLRKWATPSKARALRNPVPANPEVLAEARAHWADHCATCHANDGSGDTSIGQRLYPKAPDMRAAATQELSDGELYYIIQNGIRLSGMPAWGEAVDDDKDSWGLVHFIRHLPKLTSDELEEMKKLNPKSSHEWHEEQEEERFLRGDEPAQADEHGKHGTMIERKGME